VPVELVATAAADDQGNQAVSIGARQLPGYSALAQLLHDAHRRRGSAILMHFGEAVGVRYMIDGVWHNLPAQPLEAGQQVVQVLGHLGHLGGEVPQGRWRAPLAFRTNEENIDCNVQHTDADGGSRWLIQFSLPAEKYETLPSLGMRDKVAQSLIEQMEQAEGILLFSALPAGGLTTTFDTALRQVDRFMRDFVSVEDENDHESEVVNVDRKTYNAAAGESPASILASIGRANRDVVVCRNLVNADSVKMLCQQAADGTLIMGSIAAKDSSEALLRVLVMKVPPTVFAPVVNAVLHVRLIRKLCEDCREAYTPSAEYLKKLGIPPGKVEHLYRKPKDPDAPVCNSCDGIGYYGRTGLFELLVVDDTVRQILTSGKPQLDVLRKAARRAGLQTEMEHGILLVAQGVTSVEELQRALKT
jgi:type II secretory ATPase GspE/PulE/Tfp pilus assembly ATPase PilB-like protein